MNIKLTKLSLKNFKGIKELDINFANVTSIKGANATGKTTIVHSCGCYSERIAKIERILTLRH